MSMCKYKCNMPPHTYDGYFTTIMTNREIQRCNTRNKGYFNIPKRKSKFDFMFLREPVKI